ncbi:MAG: hypothetical protein J5916_11490, partial [Oscillospiraceae bacterium]|nr:hypothetical protein [Oscillospiraceae bacterium]
SANAAVHITASSRIVIISDRICLPVLFIPSSLRSICKIFAYYMRNRHQAQGQNPAPLLISSELSALPLPSARPPPMGSFHRLCFVLYFLFLILYISIDKFRCLRYNAAVMGEQGSPVNSSEGNDLFEKDII